MKVITSFILVIFVFVSAVVKGYAGTAADKLRPNAAVEGEEIKDGFEKMSVHLKKHLGANAVLGVSATMVRQAAETKGLLLYQFIAQNLGNQPGRENFTPQDYLKAVRAINPIMNVMNGGAHADWVTDIQEFMLAVGFGKEMPFSQRMEMANKVVAALTDIFKSPKELTRILGRKVDEKFSVLVGDEGGYAPKLKGNEEALKLLTAAIEKAGLTGKVSLAIDAAITELYDEKSERYNLKTDNRSLTRLEWAEQLQKWVKDYDIVSTEDIFAENDWAGWKEGFKRIGNKVLIIGDDLTVTNIELLKKAIDEEAINSILIKINQNGSISGTLETIQYALLHGITVAISHRSGETEDAFISHLVVASNLFEKRANPKTGKMPIVLLKTGGFKRSDRIAKYNEILRIEADLQRRIQGVVPALNQPGLSPKTIIDVYAVEIYDSRGNPTVESVITLNDGTVMRNAVPSGASTGSRESIELRDGVIVKNNPEWVTSDFINRMFPGKTAEEVKTILAGRVGGKGVKFAVYNVNFLIAPLIIAKHPDMSQVSSLADLAQLDNIMFGLELKLAKNSAYLPYIQAENTVYSVSGGGALDNFVEKVSKTSGDTLKKDEPRVFLVTPDVFRKGGVRNVLRKAVELNKVANVKVAFYSDKTEELKDILGIENENIITARNLDELLKEISNRNIDPAKVIALVASENKDPEDKDNDDSAKLKEAGIRQIVTPDIATLAMAKAIKELFSDFDFVRQAFNDFLSKILIEDKIILPINSFAHTEIIGELKEGVFVFSDQVELKPEITEAVQKVIDTETYKEFIKKFV